MRIAYISYEFPPDSSNGGIATYLAQAARMMARRGHEVEVFASSPRRFGRFESDGIVEHWIQETNRQQFGIVAGHFFAARHAEKPFDVLEGSEYNADARKAVELKPTVPLVVKMHTPSLMIETLNAPTGLNNIYRSFRGLAASLIKRKPIQPFYFISPSLHEAKNWDRVEATHARAADIVAPPCQGLCDYAKVVWNVSEDAIRLAPHPFRPPKGFLELQPKAQGLTVGFVGRLEKRKGIETLVAAIPSVLNAVPEAKFRFIGTVLYHPDSGIPYDKWIQLRLPKYMDRLEFSGKYPLERMIEAYDSLDICVFPSLWENFPNVCLEGMAAGRAIIASSAGGMAEMLDHGGAGRLIASRDSVSLAREIISLLIAPTERIRLGELARKRVLETYNEGVVGEMMERIYHEAIDRKGQKLKAATACNYAEQARGIAPRAPHETGRESRALSKAVPRPD
jgi:glycosyltransferase involved in cell wall biosynthesis